MSKWVTEKLEELLVQINEVPYTDDREHVQLTILMNGFAKLNSQAMDKAAVKTRKQMRGWSLDDSIGQSEKPKTSGGGDDSNDELTRLRPIR